MQPITEFARMAWLPLAWSLIGITVFLGLIAIVSPRCFRYLAAHGGQWVDSSKLLSLLDKRIDIDTQVLRHSRLFGICVLSALAAAAIVLIGHF